MGQKTEECLERDKRKRRVGSLRTSLVKEQFVQVGPRRGLVLRQTQSVGHLLCDRSQKFVPSGVLEAELVGVNFECISDGSIDDGFRSFTKRGLCGSGFDKLSITFAQRKADRADPLNVQTRQGCRWESLAEGKFSLEIKVSLKDILEVVLRVPLVVRDVTRDGRSKFRTRKFPPIENSDGASSSSGSSRFSASTPWSVAGGESCADATSA